MDDLLGGRVEREGGGSNINKPWSGEPYILVGKYGRVEGRGNQKSFISLHLRRCRRAQPPPPPLPPPFPFPEPIRLHFPIQFLQA